MAMGGSKEDIRRKFSQIVDPQANPAIAETLTNFLLAAPSGNGASESAVLWTLGRLWVDDNDPREDPS